MQWRFQFFEKVGVDCVYYLCGNFFGVYYQYIQEVTIRRSFIERRKCISSTINKNLQNAKEVSLSLHGKKR